MSVIYLVRHGLRVSRDEETALSADGVGQAELTGRALKNHHISHIFVSPVKRTLQTAEIINVHLKIPVSSDSRLKERMEYHPDYGSFEAFLDEWDKTMADRSYQPPHGDSAVKAGQRMLSVFDELDNNKNYLFISHGGIIGDAMRNLFPDQDLPFSADHQKNLQWLNIPECSITEIYKDQSTFTLRKIADTSHLV